MKKIEWRKPEKKAEWGPGPWQEEPDTVQWPDEKTGLPCLAKRNMHGGNWCGYVGVAEGHPAFEQHYDAVRRDNDEDSYIDVHGGLTFSDFCRGVPGENICHLPEAGEPERVWWLGFDCAHYMDHRPSEKSMWLKLGHPEFAHDDPQASYRTLAYVQSECEKLAAQLAGPLKIEKRSED